MLDRKTWAAGTSHIAAISDYDTSKQPRRHDSSKHEIWTSMLDGVASGKRLPKRNILVLGGTSDAEREFLESLALDPRDSRRQTGRASRTTPPIANQFALGYTYQDILDADQEDTLARLSVYFLTEPTAPFANLLRPLLTSNTLPECLVVLLLDWVRPWVWLRELRAWICFLKQLLASLDEEAQEVMEEVMTDWRERRRGGRVATDGDGGMGELKDNVSIPLGAGEWDEVVGLPICVVCQNADKMEHLEKEMGWREEDFDFVLQSLRTVLLKHGASLIYTSPSTPNSLQTLIYESLGIKSLLNQPPLRHNIVERQKVLIPSNWDSWGKIRVLREGFDVEGMSISWSNDIQSSQATLQQQSQDTGETDHVRGWADGNAHSNGEESALFLFEETVRDPNMDPVFSQTHNSHQRNSRPIEIESLDTQKFLSKQLQVIETIKAEQEQDQAGKETRRDHSGRHLPSEESSRYRDGNSVIEDSGRVNEHIGPVRFNMGGIQVDADDMLRNLKDREAGRNVERDTQSAAPQDGKSQNDALASFFAGLMKRGGSNSPRAPSS